MFILKNYICTNYELCKYGYAEYLYHSQGLCNGCGQELQYLNTTLRWRRVFIVILILALTVYVGWEVYFRINPPLLINISFENNKTDIKEDNGTAEVWLKRINNFDQRVIVNYKTVEGTATSGQDFESVSGQLIFNPNEENKSIIIPIMEDENYQEKQESFYIKLLNVENNPKHRIIIENRKLVLISNVKFEDQKSEVEEDNNTVEIWLNRIDNFDQKLIINYQTEEASATTGKDFEFESGHLIFNPGEKRKSIIVPIIEDDDYKEKQESFFLILLNVENSPKHRILIVNKKLNVSTVMAADALINNISILAIDMAHYTVKISVANKLLNSNVLFDAKRRLVVQRLNENKDNLNSARERFIIMIRDMVLIDQMTILKRMDIKIENLRKNGFKQQSLATEVVKKHFELYLKEKIMNMDNIEYELWDVMPKIEEESDKLLTYHSSFRLIRLFQI